VKRQKQSENGHFIEILTKNAIKQQKTLVRTFAEESKANGERRAANGANFSLALCAKLKFNSLHISLDKTKTALRPEGCSFTRCMRLTVILWQR
jgi:hypothetical protein